MVYNNQGGKDAQLLKRFGEPSWNFQVVRFLDHEAKDIIPRKDGVNTRSHLARRMIAVLEKQKRPVPKELRALAKN